MSQTVAQYMLDRLHTQWGVSRTYGYPGDGINGLIGAVHEVGDDEAVTDPEYPPMPPRIKFDQAKSMAQALVKDPARGRIIRESATGELAEFVSR